MRTFFCSAVRDCETTSTDAVVVASDEWRALELVRRELVGAVCGAHVEIRERGQVLWSGLG